LSVNGIIERIQRDAVVEAEKIKQQYLTQVNELEKQFDDMRKEKLEDTRKRAETERKKSCRRTIDHWRSIESRRLLAHKHKLLDKFYREVRKYIENLPTDEYREYFAELLTKLGESEGKILISIDTNVLDDDFRKIASNFVREKTDKETNFVIEIIDGNFKGFILDCGKVRYDVKMRTVMELIRERTGEIVIGELFGE